MSNLFYHLTDSQWKKIEFFFPARRRVRPPLNSTERVGATCPFAMATLRALNFATNKYSLVQMDSTFCKVHKHGLGARKILGDFQLIGVVLTGGQIHDSECAITLLSTVNLVGKTVLADKAFHSENNAVIKHDFDEELYKQRNIVERFFQRICRLYSSFIIYQHTQSAQEFINNH